MIAVVAGHDAGYGQHRGAAGAATSLTASTGSSATVSDYVVLVADGSTNAEAAKAVQAAGGTIDATNAAVGVLKVSTSNPSFVNQVSAAKAVEGAARDKVIGRVPTEPRAAGEIERLDAERSATSSSAAPPPRRPRPPRSRPRRPIR
jgi:hypothetical protein